MIEIVALNGRRRSAAAADRTARKATKKSPAKRRGGGRRAMTSPATKTAVGAVLLVRVLVDKNPKRLKAAERFALYEDGMPVTRYAELVGDAAQAYRDLIWDSESGFIELVPSDEVDGCGADESARNTDMLRGQELAPDVPVYPAEHPDGPVPETAAG